MAPAKKVVAGSEPAGAYSPGLEVAGRLLFVSGQGPLRDGKLVSGTIEEETELAVANLRAVVEAAGGTLADVARCGVFLADLGDFAAFDRAYRRLFPEPLPTRTTVGATLPGFKIEIDAVAVLPERPR